VICITDEVEAAVRDELLLAAAEDPESAPIEPPAPSLGPGIRDARKGEPDQANAAGSLFPQGTVSIEGRRGLLEDQTGGGFALYARVSPASLLDADTMRYARRLNISLIEVTEAMDLDAIYRAWLDEHGCIAALVRPDFYVFGIAATAEETVALVRRLRTAITNASSTDQELLAT
jgi:hypothetical protein